MFASIAQSVEQLPFKETVVGSIPTGRTNIKNHRNSCDFLYLCVQESLGDFRVGIEARLSGFCEMWNKISNRDTGHVMTDKCTRGSTGRTKYKKTGEI
jgi:hypothetical protein